VNTTGVLAGKTVTAISAGSSHSCAVADGKAYCWGRNIYGMLGNNSTTNTSVPVPVNTAGVMAGKTVTAITAGGYHSCAVAAGATFCWGYNSDGQLGNTSTTDSSVPVAVNASGVLASKTVTGISVGGYHACAVADGKAYCWGYNAYGQLGNNTTTKSTVPVAVNTAGVLAGRTVTAITAGYHHSCAVVEGRASCWGANVDGRLGNDTTTNSLVPVPVNTSGVLAGKTVTAIAAGDSHSCAVADGRAYCWGYNTYGQLGNSTTTNSTVPVPVDISGPLAGRTVTAIAAGSHHSAVLAAAPPTPPTSAAAVPGNGAATVSWNPPADDGGSPVLEYVATAVPGGAKCTATGNTCAAPGLANGTAYTFTVTARNAIGTSAPSAPSAPVIPAAAPLPVQPPGKVKGVKVKVRKDNVKVTWKQAARATAYIARISKPGSKKYENWKTTSKRVFKAKVRMGKKYRVQVRAEGPGGRGPTTTKRFKTK
jgi:alpha-tubulin suppressor-like RCC1 family protein